MEPVQRIRPEDTSDTSQQIERRSRSSAHLGAIRAIKAAHAGERNWIERIAERMTRFASAPWFFILHIVWFTAWIVVNSGITPIPPFDPYPFGFLTMVVSLEAIFLSIFVLMAQGRESAIAELREELTLQVNLRMEAEVTKTLQLVAGLYTRLGHKVGDDPELREMLQPLDSQLIERELVEQIHQSTIMRPRGDGTKH
ncbi:MAG TPA: DUF1003 domain-containing protein [Longimicrobiales bacterium]